MEIRNPRTGKFDFSIQPIDANSVRSKTISLRASQPGWLAKGIEQRVRVLQQWHTLIEDYSTDLLESLIDDTGRKTESEKELNYVLRAIDSWCEIAKKILREPENMATSIPVLKLQNHYEPFPLVGVVSGWCFPFAHLMKEIIPALLAGSSVIAKPSCVTPRFVRTLNHTIHRTRGLREVLSLVEGTDEILEPLCSNVDFVCYNGTATEARQVSDIAHKLFKPSSIQHGLKNTVIVTETADLENASSAILLGGFWNAGQSSSSIERVYVHRNVYHLFLSRLVGKANLIRLAYPTTDSGQIGPIIAEPQINIINGQLWEALENGAKLLTGIGQCEKWEGGYYCRPTIITNVKPSMKILNEETLAPILPVMAYQDTEEICEWVNGITQAHSGAIFSKTATEAITLGDKLSIPYLSINDIALEEVLQVGQHPQTNPETLEFEGTFSNYKKFFRKKTFIINTQKPFGIGWIKS